MPLYRQFEVISFCFIAVLYGTNYDSKEMRHICFELEANLIIFNHPAFLFNISLNRNVFSWKHKGKENEKSVKIF